MTTRRKARNQKNHQENMKLQPLTAKTENQKDYIRNIAENDITICTGPSGSGKAQPLDSKVYTPSGYKLMGDLRVGDRVSCPNNKIGKVTKIHPQGIKQVYKIDFKNGNSVECCEDHLWFVEEYNGKHWREKLVDVNYLLKKDLLRFQKSKGWNRHNFRIKSCGIIKFDFQNLEINPYIMGCLLGDGGITQKIGFTSGDEEIVNNIREMLPKSLGIRKLKNSDYEYCIYIKNKATNKENEYTKSLKKYKLFGESSLFKFIPQEYKYNLFENRLLLVQGLMDTDGTLNKDGSIEFSSSSKRLAEDLKEVLESIGCIVSINVRKTKRSDSYRLYITNCENLDLFKLNRKKSRKLKTKNFRKYHYISSIEKIKPVEAQCITIDTKNSIYITDNFIPTHNSYIAAGIAAEKLYNESVEQIIVTRPLFCTGKEMGALPGDVSEKIMPHLAPMEENLRFFFGKVMYGKYYAERSIKYEPLELMRGATFHNAIMILDEAQNCTEDQIKMFITRMGENSKVIINGDLRQTDLCCKNGLVKCLMDLNDINGIAISELKIKDIQRNGIIGRFLEAWECDYEYKQANDLL